jgi:hypothetical protein
VKFVLIIYGNKELWASVPADERDRIIGEFDVFIQKFRETGELLGAYGVADAEQTKVVRVRDGAPVVTDGPYLETKEYLASWYLVDVSDEARALEIAAQLPAAAQREVEVWPILHEG